MPEMQESTRRSRFPDCKHVFFGEGGKPIVDFRKAWREASEAAGIPGLLFHDLRRTAARNMRRAGIAENVVMKIAGWKTNSMFRRYDIVDGNDLRDAARKMEQYHAATGTILGTVDLNKPQSENETQNHKLLN